MRREKFYFFRTCKNENGERRIETEQGYKFKYGKLCYAIHKLDKFWTATEVTTGLLVGIYAHRLSDIPERFKEWDRDGKLKLIEDQILSGKNTEITTAQRMVYEYIKNAECA